MAFVQPQIVQDQDNIDLQGEIEPLEGSCANVYLGFVPPQIQATKKYDHNIVTELDKELEKLKENFLEF